METRFNAKRMAYDAMLAAMYYALSFVTLRLWTMQFSVSGLPVLLGAMLFGPLDGFLIGAVGAFLEQLQNYGITATTVLWILPVALRGLITGFYAKAHGFKLSRAQTIFITVLTAVILTVTDTIVMYVDSKIYGYYSKAYVFGALAVRFLSGIVMGLIFSLVLPSLHKLVCRAIGRKNAG